MKTKNLSEYCVTKGRPALNCGFDICNFVMILFDLSNLNLFRFIYHAEKLAEEGESDLCVQILSVLQDMLERKNVTTEKVNISIRI